MQRCGAEGHGAGLTIAGDVQFHQLHEVGHLGGKSLDLIVTQAQFTEVQKPKERLGQKENRSGSEELCEQFSPQGKPKLPSSPLSALVRLRSALLHRWEPQLQPAETRAKVSN